MVLPPFMLLQSYRYASDFIEQIRFSYVLQALNFGLHTWIGFRVKAEKTEHPASMLSLKKKLGRKKRHTSSSSSTHASVSDLDDRVIMFCEDVPSEYSYECVSLNREARFNCASLSDDFGLNTEQHLNPQSYRKNYYTKVVPAELNGYYCSTQGGHQKYDGRIRLQILYFFQMRSLMFW